MDQKQILNIVERYSRDHVSMHGDITVTPLPNLKTIFIERMSGTDAVGRSIILTEYKVDEKTYWAGFSSRSKTVYVSRG